MLGLNYTPEPTGIAPYTAALAEGLHRRGTTTRVITAHPHYPAWQIEPGYGGWTTHETIGRIDVTRVRHYVPRHPHIVNRAASEVTFGMRQAARRWGGVDAIVTVSPALLSSAIVRLRAAMTHPRTPFVVWVQDIYSLGLSETQQGGGLGAQLIRAVERRVLRSATHVVVIHDRFARRLHAEFGIPLERICVIRNWAHVPIPPAEDIAAIRRIRGWDGDETIVVHAGSMGVKQGLENVVHAARISHDRGAPVRFVLLGDGSQRERLRALADDLPNVEFVHMLPEADFAAALTAADILLVNELPGVSEMAVPSKLTSYFAAGRPIVAATDPAGITAEEVRTAGAGIIVPPGEPEKLADAIDALRTDAAGRSDFGDKSRRFHDEALGEETAIDAFDSLLSALIDASRNPSVVASATTPRPHRLIGTS